MQSLKFAAIYTKQGVKRMTDLTQDWKDGKLKEGLYYVQFPYGDVLKCKLFIHFQKKLMRSY
jgi:hypothetical protein